MPENQRDTPLLSSPSIPPIPWRTALSGLAASVPVALGYVPIAFSFGVAAVQAGLQPAVALLLSLLVYAGASQFLLITLLTSGAGLWATLPTVLLMNARHALYGPALTALTARADAPQHGLPTPCLAFGLTDEVFATAMGKLPAVPPAQRDHWLLGLQMGAYAAWLGGTALGVLLVQQAAHWPVAVQDGLAFVLPALFFALLLETGLLRWWRPMLAAAAVTALTSAWLPGYQTLALGIVAGALAQWTGRRQA